MIIGISGKFASGKDHAANHLVNLYDFTKIGFADKLKSVCADLFGMVEKDRTLLQVVGQKMREVDELVWVCYALKDNSADSRIVVPDVRYRNEAKFIRNMGGILIRLECGQYERVSRYEKVYGYTPSPEQINHASETDLDDFLLWDYVIYTTFTSKTDTADHVDAIMKRLGCAPSQS
jgi:hypothetical protein